MEQAAGVPTQRRLNLHCTDGKASDDLERELKDAGYEVYRERSLDLEPVVREPEEFRTTKGYDNIYQRYLTTPIGRHPPNP